MIPEYKVTALKMGTLTVDKSTLTYFRDFGQPFDIPVWAAAVEGDGKRILVDTGISDADWINENGLGPCLQEEDESLKGALGEIGWDLDEIETVVNTHLHWDHCDNNSLLPNANFYVSEKEWRYAHEPIDTQSWIYIGSWKREPLTYFNYTLVSSDHFDLAPGLRLVRTPGHSAGHQSLLVNTSEGVLAISGDAANLIENLTSNVPPGILFSTEEALHSMKKLKNLADRVLTGHDTSVEKFQTKNFPLIGQT